MADVQKKSPVWLVPHPTYRYEQDVKVLARKAGLRVIDPAVAGDEEIEQAIAADKAPKLTLKPEYAPAKTDAKKEA